MMKYDFFVAGKMRNADKLKEILQIIRRNGKTAWCFIEKSYYHDTGAKMNLAGGGCELMKHYEKLDLRDDFIKKVFDDDLAAQRESKNFLMVLPAGNSVHIEAGISFGLGKKCYAIGRPEKTESLYHIFDKIFANENEFEEFLKEEK